MGREECCEFHEAISGHDVKAMLCWQACVPSSISVLWSSLQKMPSIGGTREELGPSLIGSTQRSCPPFLFYFPSLHRNNKNTKKVSRIKKRRQKGDRKIKTTAGIGSCINVTQSWYLILYFRVNKINVVCFYFYQYCILFSATHKCC